MSHTRLERVTFWNLAGELESDTLPGLRLILDIHNEDSQFHLPLRQWPMFNRLRVTIPCYESWWRMHAGSRLNNQSVVAGLQLGGKDE